MPDFTKRKPFSIAAPTTLTEQVRQGSVDRREHEKDALRATIFRAAADLLVEQGYTAFSLRKLAARIGYSATTIYRYFRDKDELVMAVMDEGFHAFGQQLHAAVYGATDPFDQLEALGRAYVRFGFASPMFYRVMFMQRCDVWEKLSDSEMHDKLGSYQLLVATVQRCIDSGRMPVTEVEGLACTLWAHMHGIVSLGLTMPFLEPADVERMTDHSSAMMRQGLITR